MINSLALSHSPTMASAASVASEAGNPWGMSATALGCLIAAGRLSVEEAVTSCLERARLVEPHVRAFEFLDETLLLTQARALDARLRESGGLGPLWGAPVGVKDVFNTADMPTSMGSSLWAGFTPGNDARTVHAVRQAGGVIMGKTVTAEFAVHYLPAHKTTNPHDPGRIPGTSSSGSAAAVSSGVVPLALCTQTAGSIIRPASFCGVWGFKPTFGTVPRTGVLKTTDTLDSIGCMARCVEDLILLFDTIRVRGRDYPYVQKKLDIPQPSRRLRLGVLTQGVSLFSDFPPYALEILERYVSRLSCTLPPGASLELVPPMPELNTIHGHHATIYDKALSYYFSKESGQHGKISTVMRELIDRGNKISLEEYRRSLQEQVRLRRLVTERLAGFDAVLTLSTAGEAPLLGVSETPDTCLIWTFLGFPALSIPLFTGPNGLPFGLQVVAKRYDDHFLLQIAKDILQYISVD